MLLYKLPRFVYRLQVFLLLLLLLLTRAHFVIGLWAVKFERKEYELFYIIL
jgi:hypothetical protein